MHEATHSTCHVSTHNSLEVEAVHYVIMQQRRLNSITYRELVKNICNSHMRAVDVDIMGNLRQS